MERERCYSCRKNP